MLSLRTWLAIVALAGSGSLAHAHPHVSVTVNSVIVADEVGMITAIRHAWTFDDAFSAYSTTGMDTNKDGKLSREELESLAKVNVESLHEYGFFTALKRDKESASFSDVQDYYLSHDGKALTLHFTLPVKSAPFAAKDTKFEVYDPSFFVAFNFADGMPVKVDGAGGKCTATLVRPKASITQRLSQLSESFFEKMGQSANADWSTPVRFECK